MIVNDRLYIIGNGFDLYHGIPSSYGHFRDFVSENDSELYDKLNIYFDPDSLWSDFEGTLEHLDTDEMVDYASQFLESYGHPEWSDSMHHDYQYELEGQIDIITKDLKKSFTKWVYSLEIKNHNKAESLKINPRSIYLTFNYTDTLGKLYGVHSDQILHIHNKVKSENSTLILGHSRNPNEIPSLNKDIEDLDVRIAEGNQLLDDYFAKTYKNTNQIINENSPFFESLVDIVEIYIIGHSMSYVDLKYYEEIINHVDRTRVTWIVDYYKEDSISQRLKVLTDLGISETQVSFYPTNEFPE